MPDYWCGRCGGRTSMMGHGERHDERLLRIIGKLIEEGYPRDKAVEAVGLWQIGELQLPEGITK